MEDGSNRKAARDDDGHPDYDIVAFEYQADQYRILKQQGGRLLTIDPGPYTQAAADQIAIRLAREGNADAYRLQMNGHIEELEGL